MDISQTKFATPLILARPGKATVVVYYGSPIAALYDNMGHVVYSVNPIRIHDTLVHSSLGPIYLIGEELDYLREPTTMDKVLYDI